MNKKMDIFFKIDEEKIKKASKLVDDTIEKIIITLLRSHAIFHIEKINARTFLESKLSDYVELIQFKHLHRYFIKDVKYDLIFDGFEVIIDTGFRSLTPKNCFEHKCDITVEVFGENSKMKYKECLQYGEKE